MPDGVIVGGWNFAIAAYIITGLTLAVYAWSLYYRSRCLDDKESPHV